MIIIFLYYVVNRIKPYAYTRIRYENTYYISDGIQKEAYMLGVPCVTMRENTEWVETVENGWNVLVGVDYRKIVDAIRGFEGADERSDVFGSGNASERVCEILRGFI